MFDFIEEMICTKIVKLVIAWGSGKRFEFDRISAQSVIVHSLYDRNKPNGLDVY